MLIFLAVILLLAALLEYLSLRGGAACVDADFNLSKTRTETLEDLELITCVHNAGRLPVSYCLLRFSFPLSALFPEGTDAKRELYLCSVSDIYRLWGHQTKSRSLTFQMQKRGVYVIKGREISRGDFLGLSLTAGRFDSRRTVLVYPPRLENAVLSEALGSYCGELTARRWLLRDPILTMSVREYTGHEPMHTISWSQTARRGELTVREFDYTRSLNCRILLLVHGLAASEDDLLDRCCSTVRTVCESLITAGVEAQVYTNASLVGYPSQPFRYVTASSGREEDLLEVLARITVTPCSSASVLAEACLASHDDSAAYVLVTPHNDEEARAALELLEKQSGSGAQLLAVDSLEVD